MSKSKACREKLAVYFRHPARTPQGAFCNRTAQRSHRTAIAKTKRTLSTTSGRQLRKYCVQDRAAVDQSAGSTKLRPILLLLPHEPLLLLPGNAAFTLALALVLDACRGGPTRGLAGFAACLAKGVLLTSYLWHARRHRKK